MSVPAEWEVGVDTMGCQLVGCLGSETWKERETTLPFAKIKLQVY